MTAAIARPIAALFAAVHDTRPQQCCGEDDPSIESEVAPCA